MGPLGPLRIGSPGKRPPMLPGSTWVHVRNRFAGLSELDLNLARDHVGGDAARALPRPHRRYLGREVVGEVLAVGPDVTLVRPGDRVTLQGELVSTCETLGLQPACLSCAAGNVTLCEHRSLPWPGIGAGWADEMIVHESQVFLPPEGLTDDQVLLLEPASRVVRALLRQPAEPGMKVLILGGGALGQLTAAAGKALFPGVLFALATDVPQETVALGAFELAAIFPRQPTELREKSAHFTTAQIFRRGGATYLLGGFDLVFDCEGSRNSIDEALRLTRSGGSVVMVNSYPRRLRLDPTPLWYDEVSLLGIGGSGTEAIPEQMGQSIGVRSSNFAMAARLMRKTGLHAETIITHRLPSTEFRRALQLASRPQRNGATRVVITF